MHICACNATILATTGLPFCHIKN